MKKFAAMCVIGLAVVVGCNNNSKKPASSSVTDIKPAPTASEPTPMVVMQPVTPTHPVVSDTPTTTTPAYATNATPQITGSTYTVQKGDTLYKIARAKYGDASAVKKIKEANPGMNPDQIKVGQKINLP